MWNRLFDVAEVGDLLNGRVTETRDALGLISRDWQVVGFPFQFGGTGDWKDWLFMGAGLRQGTEQADAPYLIGGAIGRPGAFRLAVEGQVDLNTGKLGLQVIVQDFF